MGKKMIFWVPLLAGLLNASFILDLVVTLGTGESLGSLLSDSTGNTVAKAVIDNIPTDPTVFWMMAGFILFFVCALECIVIYLAFYSEISQCGCEEDVNRNLGKPYGRQWGGGKL